MAKVIGLSRNLKLPWLNKTAELVSKGLPEDEIKNKINEYLSLEIKSPTNIRKTREILMNIWVYENEYTETFKAEALNLIKEDPEYALEIHWCMMLAAYPVFRDMCKFIGKMSEFQSEITLAQLKQKLFDEWGERTTLYHSIDKLVSTLKAFDVIVCDKPGKYRVKTHKVDSSQVSAFMIFAVMSIDKSAYYTLADIGSLTFLFPFEYSIDNEYLMEDKRFAISIFGGKPSLLLNC